jgi:stage 0 sporulation regulatory protein
MYNKFILSIAPLIGVMIMIEMDIELKRKKMIDLALKHGYTAKETVQCSQELDMLLNLYMKLANSSNESQNGTLTPNS